MSVWELVFLSVVQGIAEWLPISSSGHLVLFEKILNIENASLEFDIFLHLASLLVIIIFFREKIKKVLQTFWASITRKAIDRDEESDWWWYIILSGVFTAIVGYIFYDKIEIFRNVSSVAIWLLVTSILLFLTKFGKHEKNIRWYHAVILGIIQGVAVVPGLSRSGALIAIALIMKVKKQAAFSYAFLVAIPAILGSFILTLRSFDFHYLYIVGFIITVFVSYLSLGWLKNIVRRNNFYLFFIYTLALSLIIKLL